MCNVSDCYGISIKEKVTCLGIVICKNVKHILTLLLKKQEIEFVVNERYFYGRVLLSKTEGISSSVYVILYI